MGDVFIVVRVIVLILVASTNDANTVAGFRQPVSCIRYELSYGCRIGAIELTQKEYSQLILSFRQSIAPAPDACAR